MNADRWPEVERIFDALLDLKEEDRDEVMVELCGGDAEILQEISMLLRASREETPLDHGLEAQAGAFIAATVDVRPDPVFDAEHQIGAYRIDRLLGEGGMGRVYLGHRADGHFERQVAIKLLRQGSLGDEGHQRFLRERQILASLRHPNIARLLDGGVSADGTPYLAMEHVDGQPITEFCRSRNLAQDDRIRLFLQACEGVGYAHRRGIIHRDLKPANILVEESPDGEAVVYVLDFGIASRGDHSVVTTPGQVMGTLGYMAPEQAQGDHDVVDQRSDVFSLGVLLYEMLSDQRPFAGTSANDVLAQLLEGEPTPIAFHAPDLPADLATIVEACLAREQERRYVSVAALADDLHRFLDGQPIVARPVGFATRLVLKARRRPAVAIAVGIAVLAVLVSSIALFVGGIKYTRDLRRERNLAVEARGDAEQLLEFMLRDLHSGLRPIGRLDLLETVARQALEYYESRASEELTGEELRRQGLALFNTALVLEEQGFGEETLRALGHYREIALRLDREEPGPTSTFELARVEHAIGEVLGESGDLAGAEEILARAVGRSRSLAALDPPGLAWQALHFNCLKQAAWVWIETGRFELAKDAVAEALALVESLPQDKQRTGVWRHRLGEAHSYQGLLEYQQGHLEEALRSFQTTLPIVVELSLESPNNVVWLEERQLLHNRLGFVLEDTGQLEESLASYSESLELARRLVALEPANANWLRELNVAHAAVASVKRQLGDLQGALASMERGLKISRDLSRRGPGMSSAQNDLAWDLLELGRIHRDRGNPAEARNAWVEARSVMEAVPVALTQSYYQDTYAQVLLELGLREEARPLVEALAVQGWHSPELDALCRQHGLELGSSNK